MQQIRVAIVGMGYWGPKIARVLNLDPNFNLVAASDLNPNLAASQMSKIGLRNLTILSDYKDLSSFDIDLVVITVPPQNHIEICNFFLKEKINVFVEKPFGLSQDQREISIELAKKNNVRLFVDHTYIYSPEFSVVNEVLKSGEIGPLNFYTSSRVNLGLLQESTNVVEDLMIHDLAILDVLKGQTPIRVNCMGSISMPAKQIGTAFANLVYLDGFIANISVSWHSPVKIRQINIVGQSGAITWDDTAGSDKIKIYNSKIENSLTPEDFRISYHLGDGRIPQISALEPLVNQFQKIALTLKYDGDQNFEILTSEEHILRTGKTLEALTKSLNSKQPVDVK